MTTVSNIKKAAEKKGWPIEENENVIGIKMAEYVWYWWSKFSDGGCIRNHIYSQNTGSVSKSFRRFFKAEDRIEKIINK